VAVANRYFGAFEDRRIKVRGIEARRRDTPTYIKETQLAMLDILSHAADAAGFRTLLPQAVSYATERLRTLRAGEVPLRELIVTQRLSRRPDEYTVRTAAARVARQLSRAGVTLHPGERMRFVLVPGPEKARAWETVTQEIAYDRQAYSELMLRAIDSVFAPLGVGRPTLETWLLGQAGYWGPPGTLPPPGVDIETPLLTRSRIWSSVGIRPPTVLDRDRAAVAVQARALLPAA
jgi:DNA polymerase-2